MRNVDAAGNCNESGDVGGEDESTSILTGERLFVDGSPLSVIAVLISDL